MKNKEIVKNIRKIWTEELKDCKLWMEFSYNDKRSYGRRLKDVCIKLLEEKKKRFEDEDGVSYFEEFVNCWGVEGKIGSVGDGEEGYDLIFEEGSEWYEKIDKSDDWNDEEWNEWMKLNCEDLKFSVDGKI